MFPNPQAALPLPPRPKFERYRKLAKELLKICKASTPDNTAALSRWTQKWVESLTNRIFVKADGTRRSFLIERLVNEVEEFAIRELVKSEKKCSLTQAQFVIARVHGFETWPILSKHIRDLSNRNSSISRFERAADAIVNGDLRTLNRLLKQDPKLVHVRSTREHGATLLHYVSANGVEGYRQKTPQYAVEITEVLLKAGAEVNAEANVYEGGATVLGLVSTSIHPLRAGVQNPLIQILLDHGADIDHPTSAGRSNAVLGSLQNGCAPAARYLADHGAFLSLEVAAGVGRLDVIENAFTKTGRLKKGVSRKEINSAFLYACGWGSNNVVEFLLDKGLDPKVHRGDGQTATHWAAIGGQLDTMKLLLKKKPNLESINMYGGTVLGQTLWSAAHGGNPEVYSEIIKALIAAGAKVRERHVPVNEQIDDLLRGYGSEPEPTWYWYGEKPRS